MGESTATAPVAVDTRAEARKRRKAIITQHRGHEDAASGAVVPPPSQSAAVGLNRVTTHDEGDPPGGAGETGEGMIAKQSESLPPHSSSSSRQEGAGSGVDRQAPPPDEHHQDAFCDGSENEEGKPSERIDEGRETFSEAADTEDGHAARVNPKKRTQVRYDPDVPMSKEQLAVWRRECRRVRNRESAAASRARVRGRIQELEEEVEGWKAKYAQAVHRLEYLQKLHGGGQPSAPANALRNEASM